MLIKKPSRKNIGKPFSLKTPPAFTNSMRSFQQISDKLIAVSFGTVLSNPL
jgi:hypothetical protein